MLRRFVSVVSKYLKILMFVVLPLFILWAILQGYSFAWTGFGDFTNPTKDFVRGKTLWDWLELFIIPIALGIGAFFLNRSERESDRQRAEERAKVDREIATDRQREAALQSYIDRMADLLLNEKLRTTENEEVRDVARIRTLSVLRGLDSNRKTLLFQFLVEAKLICIEKPVIGLQGVDLSYANLFLANLSSANLSGADLRGANLLNANFSHANLSNANLSHADLALANLSYADLKDGAELLHANLSQANLSYAKLFIADLSFAILIGADLRGADLSFANLSSAILSDADLRGADLRGANLSGADLSGANLIDVDLKQVRSLKNAIMPNGKKHD